MLVITLTVTPPALRGDLSRWLQEISTGVYVGDVSARVRAKLWDRVKRNTKSGKATMVYSANNEQKMDFCVHNADWEPIDFDGLKLMLRPCPMRVKAPTEQLKTGFSNASKMQWARRQASRKEGAKQQDRYVVLDVETTGLSSANDEIIELSAFLIDDAKILERFHALIRTDMIIPPAVEKLTGISAEMIQSEGRELSDVLSEFLLFVCDLPVVSHNAVFDYEFLRAACERAGLPLFANRCIDTLKLARRKIRDVDDFKLTTLAKYYGLATEGAHRSDADCLMTKLVYDKLIEMV